MKLSRRGFACLAAASVVALAGCQSGSVAAPSTLNAVFVGSKTVCHGGSKHCPTPPPTTTTTSSTTTSSSSTTTTTPPTTTTTTPVTTTTTTSPTTTTTTTTTPPTTTTTTSNTWNCTAVLGDSCGAYDYAGIPNSNGYNTYVSNQNVGAQSGTAQTVYVNDPGNWKLVANDVPYGYTGVQTFPDAQQLFNNWGTAGWNGSSDTPIDSLSALKVHYSETSPTGANDIYEFAPDLWLDNYGADIMFWVDTQGRCNTGAFGDTVLGNAVIDGQNWTAHRYGGFGAEIIFVLDGTGGSGTCATQSSGTIDVKAGVDWLIANGFVTGAPVMNQLNTGWELTSADNATFNMNSYSIEATPL